jgi:hypothetical protein
MWLFLLEVLEVQDFVYHQMEFRIKILPQYLLEEQHRYHFLFFFEKTIIITLMPLEHHFDEPILLQQ